MKIPFPATVKVSLLFLLLLAAGSAVWAPSVRADFQRTKIAVLDFELIGDKLDTAAMGAIISEWFTTGMVKSGRFDVVERAMLQKIIAEQKLSTTGVIDETSAAHLGKILGVKVIITGSVLKMHDMLEINSRVISVESGSIIAAENLRGSSEADLHSLVDELIAKILRNFPLTGYIVKKDAKTAIIDLGLDSGLKSGTEFITYKEGEVIKHPKTGEVLDVEQIITGRLRITKVSKNVAIGDILGEERDGIQYGQLVKSVIKEGADEKTESGKGKAKEQPTVKERAVAKESPITAPKETGQREETDRSAAKEGSPVSETGGGGGEPPKPEKAKKPAVIKVEKKKSVEQLPIDASAGTAKQPPAVAPPSQPTPAVPAAVVSEAKDKVAILPFFTEGDASSYADIMAVQIRSRLEEIGNLTLAKSAYRFKGVTKIADINVKGLYADLSLATLRAKGAELGVNFLVWAKMDIRCKYSSAGSDSCDIRWMEVAIVDLSTGKTYSHNASSSLQSAPPDAIDAACKAAFRKLAADLK